MKQQLLLLFLFIFFSCASQKKEVIAKSTIKLEGKNTNIQDLIEINGYYSRIYREQNLLRTINLYDMFFKDGSFVNFSFNQGVSDNEIRQNMNNSVFKGRNQVSWGTYWGAYTIKGDTIITYYYNKGSFFNSWIFNECRYKVKNRTTIIPIYAKSLLKVDEQDDEGIGRSPWIDNGEELIFHPADSLPPSDNWLKENKWIWRHESDWKEYKIKIEQKKKQ